MFLNIYIYIFNSVFPVFQVWWQWLSLMTALFIPSCSKSYQHWPWVTHTQTLY